MLSESSIPRQPYSANDCNFTKLPKNLNAAELTRVLERFSARRLVKLANDAAPKVLWEDEIIRFFGLFDFPARTFIAGSYLDS